MYGNYVREATAKEVENYKAIEKLFENLNDCEYSKVIDIIGDYVFAYGTQKKIAYNKVYRLAKKYNTTVPNLYNWYCID